jgi:hypothetical protein
MTRKMSFDYVGSDSEVLTNLRISREDYEFLNKMSEKYFWARLATTQRMMNKFTKENQAQFEEYLDNLRNNETPLL